MFKILFALAGLLLGVVLSYIAPEELKAGKTYFILLKRIIFLLMVLSTGYYLWIDGKIIYVGKAKNLSRRINSDHISGEIKNTTSTVRRKVTKKLGIPHGKSLRQWMSECNFSTLEIIDPDTRTLVESYIIYFLRNKGEPLLND